MQAALMKETEAHMTEAAEALSREFASIRTGTSLGQSPGRATH